MSSEPPVSRCAARSGMSRRVVAVVGYAGPPPDAREPAPLVEAAIVDEADLLDHAPRGPVVGADADVDLAQARNHRNVPEHAPQGRGVQAAAPEPRVGIEPVQNGRAGRQTPRLLDLLHE